MNYKYVSMDGTILFSVMHLLFHTLQHRSCIKYTVADLDIHVHIYKRFEGKLNKTPDVKVD